MLGASCLDFGSVGAAGQAVVGSNAAAAGFAEGSVLG